MYYSFFASTSIVILKTINKIKKKRHENVVTEPHHNKTFCFIIFPSICWVIVCGNIVKLTRVIYSTFCLFHWEWQAFCWRVSWLIPNFIESLFFLSCSCFPYRLKEREFPMASRHVDDLFICLKSILNI